MGPQSRDGAPLIVEFPTEPGVRAIARSPADLAQKSSEAMDDAMGTINEMSRRFKSAVDRMSEPPSEVEVTFGIKLTAEAGAIVAKVGGEAALQVRLLWSHDVG